MMLSPRGAYGGSHRRAAPRRSRVGLRRGRRAELGAAQRQSERAGDEHRRAETDHDADRDRSRRADAAGRGRGGRRKAGAEAFVELLLGGRQLRDQDRRRRTAQERLDQPSATGATAGSNRSSGSTQRGGRIIGGDNRVVGLETASDRRAAIGQSRPARQIGLRGSLVPATSTGTPAGKVKWLLGIARFERRVERRDLWRAVTTLVGSESAVDARCSLVPSDSHLPMTTWTSKRATAASGGCHRSTDGGSRPLGNVGASTPSATYHQEPACADVCTGELTCPGRNFKIHSWIEVPDGEHRLRTRTGAHPTAHHPPSPTAWWRPPSSASRSHPRPSRSSRRVGGRW